MRELGADEHGRISYQEFLRRRLALRPEIEALRAGKRRSSPHHTHTPEYLPTSSDNSLGTVSGRHESWEFDSGARDLSPEPHSLQKLVEAAAGGTGNMLDLANKCNHYFTTVGFIFPLRETCGDCITVPPATSTVDIVHSERTRG
ncbi:hypothetical protein G5I_03676 [Acromyrmex echinatior]|uniref:EF-hand domain-containing protein n=1 Tax=Acromyrmex echinatior TaxID=103372 RepID=F4WDM2_ACREC|nr:hypothetical protein G5I_03676 [Acromyrmex echinatior]